jgi:iron complex outermembrane receptor protein
MVTASYSKQDELKATQRSFSAYGFYPNLGVTSTNNPGTWPGTILDPNGSYWQPGYPACAGNPYPTAYYGNCAYRYSAATDLIPDSEETSVMATLTKSLPANNSIQVQYLFTRSKVNGWFGPMFYEFGMTPATNPTYYPTAAGLTCWQGPCNAPPALGGPITAILTDPGNNRYAGYLNTEQRVLLTFAGKNAGWDYKLNLNYSQNTSDQSWTAGMPDEALLKGPSGNLSDLINPFGPQSAAGQALINSSYKAGTYANGRMKRWSVDGTANHELGDAFNAGTPATVAAGFSLEGDNFTYATTPYNDLTSAASGLTDEALEGSRTLQAVFVELDVPMAKGLDFDVSDRQDRYSDFGSTNNGKVTLRYQPFQMLTFRAAASTGFRAPSLYNLYKPENLSASTSGSMGLGNPFCVAPYSNPEWSQATCNTQGLALYGGNTKLTPETSENFDLGVVISPLTDLGITLDYYKINLKNTIANIPQTSIYGNPTALASQIVTNSSGTLTPSIAEAANCFPYTASTCGYILQTYQNTGSISTAGIDVSIQYQQRTPFGKFHEDLEGTTVTKFLWQEYYGGPTVSLVGFDGGGTLYQPALRWSHNARLDWTSPQSMFGAGISNRFYSSYIDEYNTGATQTGPQRTVGAYSTWNAYVSYRPIKQLTALFGIQNLANTNPPFTNAAENNFAAGYNATLTNPLGRDFYLNLKYDFL